MKVGIMQPYFFPYIGYWQMMNAVDRYVIYDDVNYINRGWINRNRILVNGEAQYCNLRLSKASQNKLINEIQLANDRKARNDLLSTVRHAYGKAPEFEHAYPLIERILGLEEDNLARFLQIHMEWIAEYLGIQTEFVLSSELKKDSGLRGEEKILHICKLLGADTYVNAIGGQELYSKERFREENIDLRFLKTGGIEYTQFKNTFVSNLSIIDVMMFNSKSRIQELLREYELI